MECGGDSDSDNSDVVEATPGPSPGASPPQGGAIDLDDGDCEDISVTVCRPAPRQRQPPRGVPARGMPPRMPQRRPPPRAPGGKTPMLVV